MTNWIARLHDPADRDQVEVARIVREALTEAGFEVLSVHHPLQLNPEPLRIRETENGE